MGTGPMQVQAVCDSVLAELADAFPTTAAKGSLEQWSGALGSLQQVIDTACAVQDAVIVRLAAIEPEVLHDGTIVETHRALGHAALDTPAIVSGVLNVAATHAERRVRAALALAADGPDGTSTATGLGGLHQAMATGRLDSYRAGVVADELREAPPDVAATVVATLDAHFEDEDGTHLRRRCRQVLARTSPDLLVHRARRAREESGLRRWADEPGIDRWVGTFPSEQAAQAWAAIDALAHQYRTQGRCPTIDRARAKALTDLVTGHATIDTVLTITVPATVLPAIDPAAPETADGAETARDDQARSGATGEKDPAQAPQHTPAEASGGDTTSASTAGAGDLVEVTGTNGNQPAYLCRSWLTTTMRDGAGVQVAPCHPVTGALLDDTTAHQGTGRDHLDPIDPTKDGNGPAHTCGGGDRGGGPGPDAARQATGRLPGDGTDTYRPSRRMAARIRARDRRCRFPGCSIAAIFCDIDHVRPWPHGPTQDTNLLCLCRRHHRIKQRHRWHLTLAVDGTATWTDPTGRVRTTGPADALHSTVLPAVTTPAGTAPPPPRAQAAAAAAGSTSRTRTVLPDGPHSALEFHLEHTTAPPPGAPPAPATIWRDHHGNHRLEILPTHGITLLDSTTPNPPHPTYPGLTEHWPCRRTRHRHRATDRDHGSDDPPPF